MTKAEFEELRAKWKIVEPITPWESVKVDGIYHIPPVLGLSCRDIKVTEKTDTELSFSRVDGVKENATGKYNKTSVFAKCMVVTKKF
jgi:hypothetical protein